MKKIAITLCIALSLLLVYNATFGQDFIVVSPTTDKYNGLCKPVKAGSSFQLQIKVTSNKDGAYTVSINKFSSFSTFPSWFSIDVNSFTLTKGQSATFLLTINVPIGTNELTYFFQLYFDAYKDNLNNPFTGSALKVIVDNTPPTVPTVSAIEVKSSYVTVTWNSSDVRSREYTDVNQSSGYLGIKSYIVALKYDNGILKESKPFPNSTAFSNIYTFKALTPSTSYNAFVTAFDLAENLSTSPGLSVTTPAGPPPAPTNLTVSGATFCSVTLAWTASPTATSYNVYNAAAPSTILASTPSTSFSATGLTIGTTYSFFVKAVNEMGISLPSSTLAATTQSAPPISGPYRVCASGANFSVNNLPAGCTITWNQSFNLVRVSASGYSARFASNGNGSAWIDAMVITPSCGSIQLPRLTVLALGTSLRITAKIISATGEPYVVLFTAPADGHTSYTWYVNGSSQSETGNTFDLYIPCGISKTVKCESSNFCGGSRETSNSITIKGTCDRRLSYTVSPNPASLTVTVSAVNSGMATDSTRTTNPSFTFVKVYDFQGNLKKSLNYSDASSVAIDVAGLRGGSYLFEVGNAEYAEKHQVLISR